MIKGIEGEWRIMAIRRDLTERPYTFVVGRVMNMSREWQTRPRTR